MCEKKLLDKVSLITGAASGIGKSVAGKFATEGSKVIVADVNLEMAEKTAAELSKEHGVEAIALHLNVVELADCEKGVKEVIEKFKKIDILVNNAGITRDNLVLRMTATEWQSVIDVNLKGVFNMTKSVVKYMFKERSGRIVNIASVVGLMGNAGQANYSASKGGVIALTKTCAREFSARNILVNAIAPGFIQTAMTDALSEDIKTKLAEQIPLKRLGSPDDVANCALFLSSEESSYITGEIISVNGGMYM